MDTITSGSGSSTRDLARASRRVRSLAVVLHTLFEALDGSRQPVPMHATVRAGHDDAFAGSVVDLVDEMTRTLDTVRRQLRDFHAVEASAPPVVPAPGASEVADCADRLAAQAFDISIERLIEEREDAWTALVDAVGRQRVPLDGQALDRDQVMDTYSRLLVALPAECRREFRQYAESSAFRAIVERGAAFELGRSVERRASGLG